MARVCIGSRICNSGPTTQTACGYGQQSSVSPASVQYERSLPGDAGLRPSSDRAHSAQYRHNPAQWHSPVYPVPVFDLTLTNHFAGFRLNLGITASRCTKSLTLLPPPPAPAHLHAGCRHRLSEHAFPRGAGAQYRSGYSLPSRPVTRVCGSMRSACSISTRQRRTRSPRLRSSAITEFAILGHSSRAISTALRACPHWNDKCRSWHSPQKQSAGHRCVNRRVPQQRVYPARYAVQQRNDEIHQPAILGTIIEHADRRKHRTIEHHHPRIAADGFVIGRHTERNMPP